MRGVAAAARLEIRPGAPGRVLECIRGGLGRGGGLDVDDLPAVSSAASCEGLPLNCRRTLRGSGGLVLVGVSLERLSGACESWSMKLFCVCILDLCFPSMMDDIDFCHLEELAREVPVCAAPVPGASFRREAPALGEAPFRDTPVCAAPVRDTPDRFGLVRDLLFDLF